jgi:hypothetical protein
VHLEASQQEPLSGHSDEVLGALLLQDGKHALSWVQGRTLGACNLATLKELGCFYAEWHVK